MTVRTKSSLDNRARSSWSGVASTLLLTAALFHAADGHAQLNEFNLNWQAVTASPVFPRTFVFEDEFTGETQVLTDAVIHDETVTEIIPGQTPFIYEMVVIGGVQYYHIIVGDLDNPLDADGFRQETYIQAGVGGQVLGLADGRPCTGPVTCDEGIATNPIGGLTPPGGGLGQFPQQGSVSSSGGLGVSGGVGSGGNGFNPLAANSAISGNMSGNPTRVIMQQRVVDGDLTMDFVKNNFLEKPSISNVIKNDDSGFHAVFDMNSAGNPYSSSATASVVTNTLEHTGADAPPNVSPPGGGPSSAFFDMSTDAENSVVTAGRYTWVPGTGPGQSSGTYTYVDGGRMFAPNWNSFFDHGESNPWSYPDNRPVAPP